MPRVEDEEVGLVLRQFAGQHFDPVACVANAPGVDDFPLPRRVHLRQKRPQKPDEGGPVVIGSAVGSRPAQAENSIRSWGLVAQKGLAIKQRLPILRRHHDRTSGSGRALGEQGELPAEADERVRFLVGRGHPKRQQSQLNERKEGQTCDRTVQQLAAQGTLCRVRAPPVLGRLETTVRRVRRLATHESIFRDSMAISRARSSTGHSGVLK